MKKLRHFIGDCIRLFKKIKLMLWYHIYRKMVLPLKNFLRRYFPNAVYIRTSGADVKIYRDICRLASRDDAVFNTFRVHEHYARNLGGYSNEMRQIFLDIIKRDYGDLLQYANKFQESENYGGPEVYDCGFGTFSDPTIRYIKTLGDIRKLFSSLDNYNIVEIGAGYGGQCKIISDVFRFNSYTLVDLPEVLGLDRKFLTKLQVNNVHYLLPDKIPDVTSYDLIVSNFAFAECERSIQQNYIDKILKYAQRGFIIYNFDGHPSQDYSPIKPYYKEEIIKILSQYHTLKITDDYPHPDHCQPFVITWGNISA